MPVLILFYAQYLNATSKKVCRMNFRVSALAVIGIYCIGQFLFTGYFMFRSKAMPSQSFAGKSELGDKSKTLLRVFLTGDSVAAGVGASGFETSLAGRLATGLSADHYVIFTNAAKSGNKMADMTTVPDRQQDVIVLFVSSNDLFHFTGLKKFEADTSAALVRYSKLSKKVVIVGPADIGGATAIPLIVKPIYAMQWPKYAAVIRNAAAKYDNVKYIYPAEYKEKLKTYGHTEAVDGFHPNDNGHRFWADLILSEIQK